MKREFKVDAQVRKTLKLHTEKRLETLLKPKVNMLSRAGDGTIWSCLRRVEPKERRRFIEFVDED